MKAETETGLTLEDIAVLADGTGNVLDETAAKLKPLICGDERFAEAIAALRQMAEDAGTRLLADGLHAFRSLSRLREKAWRKPTDVLDPDLDVPFGELISMAGAMAGRAEGEEQAELQRLRERLIDAFGVELGAEKILQMMMDRLGEVEEAVAEAVLSHLLGLYRFRRKSVEGRWRVVGPGRRAKG